jgi:hypothetical protein
VSTSGVTPLAVTRGLQHPLQELDGPLVRLRDEVAAWEAELNGAVARVGWQFSSADVRIRLRSLYPPIKE